MLPLANLLDEEGDTERAEHLYRDAFERGDAHSAWNPAGMLHSTATTKYTNRLRIVQSNIALLLVVAAAATFLGTRQLIVLGARQPFFPGLAAAGVVVFLSSIATYVWLQRQIP